MKTTKLKRAISAITAAVISVSLLTTLAVSAADRVVLEYTFDSETTIEKTYSTDPKSISFMCYDGQSEPFLRTLDDTHWCSGWYSYDSTNTTNGEAPSATEMYIEKSLLNLNLAANNTMKIRIPINEEGTYRIDFTMQKTAGDGQYVRFNVNNVPSTDPSAANPTDPGAMLADFGANSEQTYSKTVSLAPNDNVNFLGVAVVQKGISIAIDTMTVTKIESIETINPEKVIPANGLTNVSTYTEPTIFFDREINADTISGIKLMNGDTEIAATPTLGKDKTSVVMVTQEQLPPETVIKIAIPDTVRCVDGSSVNAAEYSFTTGKKNVVYYADFETEGNTGDYGMMYGWGGWNSNEGGRTTTVESSPINSGKAVKIKYDTAWQGFYMNIARIAGPEINNMKIEGSNVNRKYIVSFDLYMQGTGTVTATFVDTGTNPVIGTYSASQTPSVQHIEKQIDSVTAWNPAVRFKDEAGSTPALDLYLDNLKITEVIAGATPKIVSSNPEKDEQNVKITTGIEVKFDQEMAENSEVALYKIIDDESEPVLVETSASIDASKRILTVTPVSVLETNTKYALDLSAVQNSQGNTLAEEEQIINFETSNIALTGTEILYYDFEKEYNAGDNGIEHGIGSKWVCDVERSAVAPKDGNYALNMKTTGEYGNIKLSIPKMENLQYKGKKYEIAMDVKLAEGCTVNKDTEVYINYWTDVENNLPVALFTPTEQYTNVRSTFIIPETAAMWSPRLYIVHPETGYDVYIDNITIREIDEPYAQIKYTDEGGKEKIINGSKMSNNLAGKTLNVTFGQFGTKTGSYQGFISLVKEDTLVDVSVADIEVTNGTAGNYSLSLTLPETDDISSYKVNAFLWDDNLKPLMDVTGLRSQ